MKFTLTWLKDHLETEASAAEVVDAFHVEPHGGELVGQLRQRCRGLQMILEPGEGDLHAISPAYGDSPPANVGTSRAVKP